MACNTSCITLHLFQSYPGLSGQARWRHTVRRNVLEKDTPQIVSALPSNLCLAEVVDMVRDLHVKDKEGIIFEMSKSKNVDRLSVFLEKVASEHSQQTRKNTRETLQRAKIVLESIFEFIYRTDAEFQAVFDKPDPEFGQHDGIDTLVLENKDSYKLRLFLKKFTHPDSCQVT